MGVTNRPKKKANSSGEPLRREPWFSVYSVAKLCLDLATNPIHCWIVAFALLAAETVLNVAIIWKVPYTEIDWIAYMQEVSGVLQNGTYDYSLLRGDTGPLVYPAGFVWIFSMLHYFTEHGENIKRAQYLFLVVYMVLLALVFRLMIMSKKVPPYVLVFMTVLSYRVHSIFVLRLFNDPIAMLLLYAAINAFASDRWSLGSFLFSLAVSVKMNILLFAPALFLAYLATQGVLGTIKQLSICAGLQLLLAIPFLLENPISYLKGSFDLGRVFFFKWTVNWRFVGEDLFLHRGFHAGLLLLHIACLLFCASRWWTMLKSYQKLRSAKVPVPEYSIQLLLFPLYMCNFIGMVFARSLHYQFYIWYFHQLHYLLWSCDIFSPMFRILLLGLIELCWNVYPSTLWSSALLQGTHIVLLFALIRQLHAITNAVKRE